MSSKSMLSTMLRLAGIQQVPAKTQPLVESQTQKQHKLTREQAEAIIMGRTTKQAIMEAWDDEDDDMSDSERELAKKADTDLKKKGVSVKADPDKDLARLAKKRHSKEESAERRADADEIAEKEAKRKEKAAREKEAADRADADREESKAAAEEKKAEKAGEAEGGEKTAEAKRRGRAPNADSKAQRAVAHIRANPAMRRGEFLRWAQENLGMGANYASAFFARHNPKASRQQHSQTNEVWMISHPLVSSFLLHENLELHKMEWVDASSDNDPMMFESEAAAQQMITHMRDWKKQDVKLVKLDMSQFD